MTQQHDTDNMNENSKSIHKPAPDVNDSDGQAELRALCSDYIDNFFSLGSMNAKGNLTDERAKKLAIIGFEDMAEKLIAWRNASIRTALERVKAGMPEKYTDTRGAKQNPGNTKYHTKKAVGFNEAIDQVVALIDVELEKL